MIRNKRSLRRVCETFPDNNALKDAYKEYRMKYLAGKGEFILCQKIAVSNTYIRFMNFLKKTRGRTAYFQTGEVTILLKRW